MTRSCIFAANGGMPDKFKHYSAMSFESVFHLANNMLPKYLNYSVMKMIDASTIAIALNAMVNTFFLTLWFINIPVSHFLQYAY